MDNIQNSSPLSNELIKAAQTLKIVEIGNAGMLKTSSQSEVKKYLANGIYCLKN
nr:hypothetical protein [uncultured Rhodoferax sp.]